MEKLESLPEGWRFYPACANCAPKGYRLATNGKSRFTKGYESAWVKIQKKGEV